MAWLAFLQPWAALNSNLWGEIFDRIYKMNGINRMGTLSQNLVNLVIL